MGGVKRKGYGEGATPENDVAVGVIIQ